MIKNRRNLKNRLEIKDDSKTLIFVHIGKCGGKSTYEAIKKSQLVKNKFSLVLKTHLRKPPILKNASYAFVVRNPIKRAISAFNWRYKLVVTDEIQKNRFDGEYEILKKYETLNALCDELYVNKIINSAVSDEFQKIHHLKQNISHYLKPLLDIISPSQIFAVFATETLDEDIFNKLKIKNTFYIHQNSKSLSSDKDFLTEKAYSNLRTYLSEDYLYLSKLITMNKSYAANKKKLLE